MRYIYKLTPGTSPSDRWDWRLQTTTGFESERAAEKFIEVILGGDPMEKDSDLFSTWVYVWQTILLLNDNPLKYPAFTYQKMIEDGQIIPF